MSKRILVVSQLFEPNNSIGALRPTKFVKLLSEKGYEIDVYTSIANLQNCDENKLSKEYKIIYDKEIISFTSREERTVDINADNTDKHTMLCIKSIYKELSVTYRQFIAYQKGVSFLKCFKSAVQNGKICMSEYQAVFTTFGPIGSVLVGLYIKKHYPHIKWIADFRDPMVSQTMPKIFCPWYGFLQNRVLNNCDHAVTVSNGYYRRMVHPTVANKFHIIPNGYDRIDAAIFDEITPDTNMFSLAYVGALYEGKRDIGPLFSVLRQLCDEGIIQKKQIVFHYAGGESFYLRKQAKVFGMEDIIRDHGRLSRQECLRLQASVLFLVLSTWNDRGEEGVFPGKLIEYMLIERPIIAVVDGNLAHSEVKDTIQRYNLGVVYENADPETKMALYEWMKMQAIRVCGGQVVCFSPDLEAIDRNYNWVNIAKRFGELIEG